MFPFPHSFYPIFVSPSIRSLDLNNGRQSRGKFTQFKDLYFPKGCASLEFDLQQQRAIRHPISTLAKSFKPPSDDLDSDDDNVPSAQTLNEQFAPAPSQFTNQRRSGNKNDGFYYPDYSGRYATTPLYVNVLIKSQILLQICS